MKLYDEYKDKLAEEAIGIILAGSEDWFDDSFTDIEYEYNWFEDTCTIEFSVDGEYVGTWELEKEMMTDINYLDSISAEVEAAVSGVETNEDDSEYNDNGYDTRTGRKLGVSTDFEGKDESKNINKTLNNVNEGWQDDWIEPTIEERPIENINGLNIYKGTDQYGEEAYYLFPEDEDPEPGYEEWQAETLDIAIEWAESYENPYDDDWDDDLIYIESKDNQINTTTSMDGQEVSQKIEYIRDALDDLERYVNKTGAIPHELGVTLNKVYNFIDSIYEYTELMNEATSSFASSVYTKKAIDILPEKRYKTIKESSNDSFTKLDAKIDGMTSKFDLIELLHDLSDKKTEITDDNLINKLEDKILSKVNNIKSK